MGAGLKEAIYEECMCMEMESLGLSFQQQYRFRPYYNKVKLRTSSVVDLLVEDLIVVELKAVSALIKIHEAQVLNYINLLQKPKGILFNFNSYNLSRDGKKTFVNKIYRNLPDQ